MILGALCLMHDEIREMDDDELRLLETLAAEAAERLTGEVPAPVSTIPPEPPSAPPRTGTLAPLARPGLVAAGVLDPFTVIGGCVIGAVMGDAISYWIGRRLGTRVLRHHLLVPHRRKLAWTRLYCRRYGVASIFIGRFFGPLRAFVPVMVGVLQMRQRVFQIANVTSALAWAFLMLAPGAGLLGYLKG